MKLNSINYLVILISFLFLFSCKSPKQLISTSLEVDNKNELVFDITIHNSSDTVMRIGQSLNIPCYDYLEINTIWLINEDHNDTLPLSYFHCHPIIDPETYEESHHLIEPNKSHTYQLDFSTIVSGPIQKGNYKAIVKLHQWDFSDTLFYKNILITKEINYNAKLFKQSYAIQILWILDDLSKVSSEDNRLYKVITPIEKLMKCKFFKAVENNEFSFSKKQNEKLKEYAHKLKSIAKNENLTSVHFEKLRNESKYFHKKIKKAYIKIIPNFRFLLNDPDRDIIYIN